MIRGPRARDPMGILWKRLAVCHSSSRFHCRCSRVINLFFLFPLVGASKVMPFLWRDSRSLLYNSHFIIAAVYLVCPARNRFKHRIGSSHITARISYTDEERWLRLVTRLRLRCPPSFQHVGIAVRLCVHAATSPDAYSIFVHAIGPEDSVRGESSGPSPDEHVVCSRSVTSSSR
ncbi:hypothetical protein F4780DRAFT_743471 [Xylariomycetidae sp. FL0641]|nr:hypothetical protein F4780DRAFT_743471 [Xylariomycetidae sp. FL0641]